MAKVIIGIHGLANKPPKDILEKWWSLAMKEGLKRYDPDIPLPEFELVYWADLVYEKPLDINISDPDDPFYLDEVYTEAPKDFFPENHQTRQKILDFLGKQLDKVLLNDDMSLNYSFLADAVVKNFFRDLEIYYTGTYRDQNGRTAPFGDIMRRRLSEVLLRHKHDEVLLIAHSMGSIIAFDVLANEKPQVKIHTLMTIGSPLGLPVVKSRIAAGQHHTDSYGNTLLAPEGIIKNWFNFSDITDKVAFNYSLADDFSENSHRVKPIDFLVVNDYLMKEERNPHKSFGYLRTPEFSGKLYEFIVTGRVTFLQRVINSFRRLFDIPGALLRRKSS